MAFDSHKNFSYSTVAAAPSPATSGTSLTVQTGDGTKFSTPPFNVTVWPPNVLPLTSNAEIVRVTAIATDTLTITRGQEGSTAQPIAIGWQIAATVTAKTLMDVEGAVTTETTRATTAEGTKLSLSGGTLTGPVVGFQDNGSQVFDVRAYGAKVDGSTDDTTAVNNAIAAAMAVGGQVFIPAGVCLCLGAISIPYTGNPPIQKPLRIFGVAPNWNGYWATSPINGGTVWDLRFNGDAGVHVAKIDTRGAGYLELDHLTIKSGGTDNFLIMQTTNTTCFIHDLAVVGNAANSGTACTQDFIKIGGTSQTTDNSSSAAFQGYGMRMSNNFYSNIQRTAIIQNYANGIEISNETVSTTCGSSLPQGAPYYFDVGSTVANETFSARIIGGTIEVSNYPYMVSLIQGTQYCYFDGLAGYDDTATTQGWYYFGPGCVSNLIIVNFLDTGKPLLNGPAASSQTVIDGRGGEKSQFSRGAVFTNSVDVSGVIAGVTLSSTQGPHEFELAAGYHSATSVSLVDLTNTDEILIAESSGEMLTVAGGYILALLNDLHMADPGNMVLGTTTGTKIGTSTGQKLGFYGASPIAQPSGDVASAMSSLGLVGSPTYIVQDKGGQVFNVRAYGATGNTQTKADGVMSASSAVLTSATGAFTSADVGKTMAIPAAAGANSTLTGALTAGNYYTSLSVAALTVAIPANTYFTIGIGSTVITCFATATAAIGATNITISGVIAPFNEASGALINAVTLVTTIASYQSPTQVTLAAAATAAVSGVSYIYGTDDYTAIQAAITAAQATGGSVFVPPGVYTVGTTPTITAGMDIYGSGSASVIQAKSGSSANCLEISGTNSVGVRRLKFDGNKPNQPIGINYSARIGVLILNSDRVWVEDCEVFQTQGPGICGEQSNHLFISQNKVDKTGDGGIFLHPNGSGPSCSDVLIAHNIVSNAGYYGITAIWCNQVVIVGNDSSANGQVDPSQGYGIDLEGSTFCTIDGNVSHDGNGGIVCRITTEGAGSRNCAHVAITGNTMYNNSVAGVSGQASIQLSDSDYVTIVGNNCSTSVQGINIGNATNVNISDNQATAHTNTGIRCYSTSGSKISITNNYISGNGNEGIQCLAPQTFISGNRIQANTQNGIEMFNGSSKSVIADNYILDNTNNGIQIDSSGTANIEVRDNTFDNTASAQGRALFESSGGGPTFFVNNRVANQANVPFALSNASSFANTLDDGAGNLSIYDGKNIGLGTGTGTKFGTSTSQKLAFFNSAPMAQPSGDILTALSALGLVSSPSLASELSGTTPIIDSTIAPTAGSATSLARADHAHPRYDWQPSDHGFISWSMDLALTANTTVPGTAGHMYMVRLHLPVPTSVTNVCIFSAQIGATLTTGQCFAALYYASGALIGQTADQASNWDTNVGLLAMPLVGGPFAVNAGDVYVALWYNGTTAPKLIEGISGSWVNANLVAPRFCQDSHSGVTTTAPATLGTLTAQSNSIWAAIS